MADLEELQRLASAHSRGIPLSKEKLDRLESAAGRGLIGGFSLDDFNQVKQAPPELTAKRAAGIGGRSFIEGLLSPYSGYGPEAALMVGLGQANVSDFGNVAGTITDEMGLPKAETPSEKLAASIISGGASALNPTSLLAPGLSIASGMGAGLAAETAAQNGAGAGGQMAAGLAGGLAPGVGGVMGRLAMRPVSIAQSGLKAFTPGGREQIAGQTLNRVSADPAAAMRALLQNKQELVPGSRPTAAQLTGDRGLAVLEKGLASSGPRGAGLQDRMLAQAAARQQAALKALSGPAPFGGTIDTGDAGTRLRAAFDSAYGKAKQNTRQAYGAIDPEGTARFNVEPLEDSFKEVVGRGRYSDTPTEVSGILSKLKNDIGEGTNLSYKDLQDIRKNLSDLTKTAQFKGDASTARVAGGMKSNLDNYIDNIASSPELMGTTPYALPSSQKYKNATAFAREAVGADPYYDDLKYLMEQGISRDAAMAVLGKEGVDQLNQSAPGLIRKNGKLQPDVIASGLEGSRAYGLGDEFNPSNGQGLLDLLVDRLGPGRGRMRADMARRRDEFLKFSGEPHTGFSPEQTELFKAAKQARIEQGHRFESGYNKPLSLRGGTSEGEKIATALLPEHYFKPGTAGGVAMQDFNLSLGKDAGARDAMRDYVFAQAKAKATKVNTGDLDISALGRWSKNHAPALRELGIEDAFKMRDLRADIARAQAATRKAGVAGSPTAQNTATQEVLAKLGLNTEITPKTGFLGSVAATASNAAPTFVSKKLFGPTNEAIQSLLIDASLNPARAYELMAKGVLPKRNTILNTANQPYGAYGFASGRTGVKGLLDIMEEQEKRKKEAKE